MLSLFLAAALAGTEGAASLTAPAQPFAALEIYSGDWVVSAAHPWSGGAPGALDRLHSQCSAFLQFFACEQTVNGKPQALIVYTLADGAGRFHTRTINPAGLAGARGDMTIDGPRWTYFDKPAAGVQGPWSRVINIISDKDHIRFEEYESVDEGRTWKMTNSGDETRVIERKPARRP